MIMTPANPRQERCQHQLLQSADGSRRTDKGVVQKPAGMPRGFDPGYACRLRLRARVSPRQVRAHTIRCNGVAWGGLEFRLRASLWASGSGPFAVPIV